MENRQKHVTGMFPFRIIKCLRTHENLSHSTVHLSIAEPIQGFYFCLDITTELHTHLLSAINQSSLSRNEQRRYFCNMNNSPLWGWWNKHPKSGVVTLMSSTFSKFFMCLWEKSALADVHKDTWCYISRGFQSTPCQVFRELVNCYSSHENKTVRPKKIFLFYFIK